MKNLTVPALNESLAQVTEFVDSELESVDCPMAVQLKLELVVEEVFVNIASYAYPDSQGEAEVQCDLLDDPSRVMLRFIDSGVPFDPLAKEDADISPEALQSRVGGLGIFLVKKTMDEVFYEYKDGKNVLTMYKNL